MTEKRRVIVAMSGGVDSSVTAALLTEQGFDVVGVTMRLSDESRMAGSGDGIVQAAEDARSVAEVLGIRHFTVDFRELFREKVVSRFVSEYARGRTPNPCVVCNRYLKFGGLMEKAFELGADFLATGHYARVEQDSTGTFRLLRGLDTRKDQSYVLYYLTQEKLRHFLLPLGGYAKEEVRMMAGRFALPVARKAESQEICFIPDDDYAGFLRRECPECFVPGAIVDVSGRVLGRHGGVPFYTIGQRRGLGIATGEPLYVTRLDADRREVVVGTANDVYYSGLVANDVNWVVPNPPEKFFRAAVRIRYGKREGMATVTLLSDERIEVRFDEPQRAVAPGQSAVLYREDEVIGGGIIERALQ